MRVKAEVESLESRPFSQLSLTDVAASQIIAGVELIIAQLEILVIIVMLPPRTVKTGSVREVTVKRLILNSHIGDGAEAVVARHVSEVEEQIGLNAQ